MFACRSTRPWKTQLRQHTLQGRALQEWNHFHLLNLLQEQQSVGQDKSLSQPCIMHRWTSVHLQRYKPFLHQSCLRQCHLQRTIQKFLCLYQHCNGLDVHFVRIGIIVQLISNFVYLQLLLCVSIRIIIQLI